jgi:tRNA(Ile)-lysidine synthase
MTKQQNLSTRVAAAIREHKLLKPGSTVVVALSGGADSCALLDLLATMPNFPLHLIAAHLNHCLRGSDSDTDEAFCRSAAKRYNIPFETRRTDVASYAAENRLSLEEAGRQVRIAFFDELIERFGADALALGHHRDDQAETLLMRLIRGAGGTGLAGMSFSSRDRYIRPLLGITRCEIESHLNERTLSWREDASNRDMHFLRNRIRHNLLPQLELYNPGIKKRLAVTAGILKDDEDLLNTLAQQEYNRLAYRKKSSASFGVSALKNLHPALRSRIIRIAISEYSGSLRNFSSGHIADIVSLLADGPPNRSIKLPGSVECHREYSRISICSTAVTDETPHDIHIDGPGNYRLWDGMLLEISTACHPVNINETGSDTGYFDLNKAPFPWLVRTFLPGDRMNPLGMTGSKKVKCIYIDEKIAPGRRRRIPLILSQGAVTWVCGVRFSATASISNSSTNIVKAVLRNSPL